MQLLLLEILTTFVYCVFVHYLLLLSTMNMSSLDTGKIKLQGHILYDNLPKDRVDPLWNVIKDDCGLTLDELSALKNSVCLVQNAVSVQPTSKSINSFLFYEFIILPPPPLGDYVECLFKKFTEITIKSNFSINKNLLDINNKVSLISIDITPSNCCKSTKEHSAKFFRLNEALRIDIGHDLERIIEKLSIEDANELLKDCEPLTSDGKTPPVFENYNWVIANVRVEILSLVTCFLNFVLHMYIRKLARRN